MFLVLFNNQNRPKTRKLYWTHIRLHWVVILTCNHHLQEISTVSSVSISSQFLERKRLRLVSKIRTSFEMPVLRLYQNTQNFGNHSVIDN